MNCISDKNRWKAVYTERDSDGKILTGDEKTGKIFHRFFNNEVEVMIFIKKMTIFYL